MGAEQQKPIGSGWTRNTTAAEVAAGHDLAGRDYIVTGGYSGIGLETVRALVGRGARVTVPARSRARAEEALAEFGGSVDVAQMDLADLASVRAFAAAWGQTGRPLHGLVNNAGIMACPLERIGGGWESQFAVNHLGHFELARGLEQSLKKAGADGGARVVSLSSTAHIRSGILWDDIHFRNSPYDKWAAYGQSKTADALFALELDRRWQGDGVRAFSVHPGGIFTPLQRHLPEAEMVALGWKNADGSIPPQVAAMFKTPEQGAATSVWCLLEQRLEALGGVYCEDVDVAQLAGPDSQRWHHVRPWACDPEQAERLWGTSEAMIAAA